MKKIVTKSLVDQIKDFYVKESEPKEKNSFWCSESETDKLEIYLRWKGIPPTNPMAPAKRFELNMRKKIEEGVVQAFADTGILVKPKEGDQHRVDMECEGVRITGYMDALINEDGHQSPVEIKTSYGYLGKTELSDGRPKMSYLKQLAMYMDSIDATVGHLFQIHLSKSLYLPFILNDVYQFSLVRGVKGEFRCGTLVFDLSDTYKRFAHIYNNYISKDIEPQSDYTYKYDVTKIDWKSKKPAKIKEVLSGKTVLGDWQPKYSSYKDYIIKSQGTTPGYTVEELNYIKAQTI